MDVKEDSVAPWNVGDLEEDGVGGMSDVTTATGCAASRRSARILSEREYVFPSLMLLCPLARLEEDQRFAVMSVRAGADRDMGSMNKRCFPKRELPRVICTYLGSLDNFCGVGDKISVSMPTCACVAVLDGHLHPRKVGFDSAGPGSTLITLGCHHDTLGYVLNHGYAPNIMNTCMSPFTRRIRVIGVVQLVQLRL